MMEGTFHLFSFLDQILSAKIISKNLQTLLYVKIDINRVVAVSLPQLTQASFLQKNQTLQNRFLISVTLRWHRVSVACKNQSFKVDYFILPLFLVPKLRSVAQNEWKKHPYLFFLLLVQK